MPGIADKAADLIEASSVPRLRYHLRAGENWIRLDVPNDGRPGDRHSSFIARQDGSEVKPESIDVHICHPVTKTVEDHAAHDWLVGIEGITSARVIGIAAAVGLQ